MAVKKIITAPNKVLNKKCAQIESFDSHTKKLSKNLLDTVRAARNPEGAGLAAPQIGVTKRVCIVRKFVIDKENKENSTTTDYVLVNPKIVKMSKEREVNWEACLSLPGVYARVDRAKKIKVEAFDENGKKLKINTSGFFARIIQHELDHLDGVLITDKAIGETISEEEFQKLVS